VASARLPRRDPGFSAGQVTFVDQRFDINDDGAERREIAELEDIATSASGTNEKRSSACILGAPATTVSMLPKARIILFMHTFLIPARAIRAGFWLWI
jgi:hypothetical protein